MCYARFTTFRFFYYPDRDGPTRVLLPFAFSTARTGPALRAFYCLLLFLLHGPGPRYARFSAFRFFYCPDRDRTGPGAWLLPIKGINRP